MAIIKSLLDTDLYKITMLYAVLKTCDRMGIDVPQTQYRFKCRNKKNLLGLKAQVVKEVEAFKKLRFTKEDIDYLMSLNLFEDWFAKYLMMINLNDVNVMVYDVDGELKIDIEGKWVPAILFEVPVLSIVNELYFAEETKHKPFYGKKRLLNFFKEMNGVRFTDFGTRRRFSRKWHENCIEEGIKEKTLIGTSNVYFARKYGIKPVGTMAHEWLQAFQALSGDLKDFQKDALNHWMLTYRGKLDTALTDIIGLDAFLKDWDGFFAKNYSALRHDSGCPIVFMNKVIRWYQAKNLPIPRLLFSDGLTPKTCHDIVGASGGITSPLFGIGTNFTNNCGPEPLQIVIKLAKVNGEDVVKISDSAGKAMSDNKIGMYQRLKETFNLKGN